MYIYNYSRIKNYNLYTDMQCYYYYYHYYYYFQSVNTTNNNDNRSPSSA